MYYIVHMKEIKVIQSKHTREDLRIKLPLDYVRTYELDKKSELYAKAVVSQGNIVITIPVSNPVGYQHDTRSTF